MRMISSSKKKGQSLIEYALILAMVAVVAIAALQLLGDKLGGALRGAAETVGVGAENAGKNACESMGKEFSWEAGTEGGGTCKYNGGNSNKKSSDQHE